MSTNFCGWVDVLNLYSSSQVVEQTPTHDLGVLWESYVDFVREGLLPFVLWWEARESNITEKREREEKREGERQETKKREKEERKK